MSITDILRQEMRDSHLTLDEIAEAIDEQPTLLAQFMTVSWSLSSDTIDKLCALLGLHLISVWGSGVDRIENLDTP